MIYVSYLSLLPSQKNECIIIFNHTKKSFFLFLLFSPLSLDVGIEDDLAGVAGKERGKRLLEL